MGSITLRCRVWCRSECRPAITIAGRAYSAFAKHCATLPVLLLGDLAARVAFPEDLLRGRPAAAAVPAVVVVPPPAAPDEQHDQADPQQREEREPPVRLVSDHRS